MLTTKELRALSPEDETIVAKAVQQIDKFVQAAYDNDATQKSFEIPVGKLAKKVADLNQKVRDCIIADAIKGGWNVTLTADTLTLSFKQRGRKAKDTAAGATVEPAPEITVVEANELEPAPSA